MGAFAIGLLLFCAGSARAAELTVQLSTIGGKPVADAVIELHAVGRPTPAGRVAGPYLVSQRDKQFHPFVTIVPAGADVSFPNFDPFRHHVYSFSAAKRFELKLYARDQTRSVRLDTPGVVALGCNIHDSMTAFIYVTNSGWTAKTDAAGRAVLVVPPGQYLLGAWHPYLRAPGNRVERPVTIAAGGRREAVVVELRAPPLHDMTAY